MAQVARERRPLRLRAQGPLPPQRSAVRSRSHHRDSRSWAARNQALPGSFEQDARPLLSPRGRQAPKPDGKPGRGRLPATPRARRRGGTSSSLRHGDRQPGLGRFRDEGPEEARKTGASAASSGPTGHAVHAGGCS